MSLLLNAISVYETFVLTYATASLVGFAIDYFGIYEHLKEKNRSQKEYITLYKKCLPNVTGNVCLYSGPFIYAILYFQQLINGKAYKYPDNYTLSFIYFIYYCLMMTVLTDIFFYLGHRLMHSRLLYKYHKLHHEIKYPISIAGLYMHPLDLYIANLSPLGLSTIILNYDILTLKIFIIIQLVYTTLSGHGGYKYNNHTYHHKLFRYNYGAGFKKRNMDTLLKTEYLKND